MNRHLILLVSRRLLLGLLSLWVISILIFLGTEILPGDVAQTILGQSATPETVANLRKELGLDRPPLERYIDWFTGILRGDLGQSLSNQQDIATMLGGRLQNTLFLAAVAALVSVPLAIFLGMLAVRFKDTWLDKTISSLTLMTISLPEFFVGYVLILFFAIQLPWFSPLANVYDGMGLGERLQVIVLPCATLTLVVLAHMMRMTRAAILGIMNSSYVEMARLKGVRPFDIIFKHAFPNALSPVINVVVLNLAYLVVGVVVVEVIFVYPGMGQLMVDHVAKRDVPVVQACGLIFAATYIILNMLADIFAIISNPRLRHPR